MIPTMRIRIVLLSSSFALLRAATAWNHITEARFRQALRNEYTLVACKLLFPEHRGASSWLIIIRSCRCEFVNHHLAS